MMRPRLTNLAQPTRPLLSAGVIIAPVEALLRPSGVSQCAFRVWAFIDVGRHGPRRALDTDAIGQCESAGSALLPREAVRVGSGRDV